MVGVGSVVGVVITSVKEKKKVTVFIFKRYQKQFLSLLSATVFHSSAKANEHEKMTEANKSNPPFLHRLQGTLFYSPKFCRKNCSQFLLGITVVPREIEDNSYAKFWG